MTEQTDAQTARAIVEREAHLLTVDVPAMFDRIAEGIAQALAATRAATWERAAQLLPPPLVQTQAKHTLTNHLQSECPHAACRLQIYRTACVEFTEKIRALTHPTPEPTQ